MSSKRAGLRASQEKISPSEVTLAKLNVFVEEYVKNYGHRRKAAEAAGINYDDMAPFFKDESFLAVLKEAQERWHEELRNVAIERAKQKSDILLIFMLKALKPELYDDDVRKIAWMNATGITEQSNSPVRPIMVREDIPTLELPPGEYVMDDGEGNSGK